MAVVVTDTRIVITEADNTTGWTGADQAGTDFFCEAPNAIQSSLAIATDQVYYTDATSRDVSGSLIYVYSFNNAIQNPWTDVNPPNALHLGDGTNRVSFKMAGSDRRVFNHADGPTEWQCFVLDGSKIAEMEAAGYTTTRAGSYASFLANIGALVDFGSDFDTLSKALGGGFNVGVDIIRFGKDGLRVTGGSSGDPGIFLEVVEEDRSTTTLKAHGIIREYTAGVYGLQGPLTFGTASAAGSWFEDSNISLTFEDRNINDDKLYVRITGSAAADTTFILKNSAITTAGPNVTLDFSGSSNTSHIRKLELTGNTFSSLGNPVYFGNNYSSSFHTASNCTFANCGIITAGNIVFDGNTIQTGKNHSGSLLLDSSSAAYLDKQTDNMSNLSFIASGTTGHAIYITEAAATYSFSGFSFSGFGADGSAAASIYNNSGGSVLINLIGTSTPTVRNGGISTTTLSSPATLTLTGMVSGTEVTITSGSDSTVLYHLESVDVDGEAAYSYTAGGIIVDILIFEITKDPQVSSIFNYTLLTEDATIPIQQIDDNIYFNPGGEGG